MNVENRIKKKKPTTQFHPREMSALLVLCFLSTLHHCNLLLSFYPSVTLSPICFAFVLKSLCPLLWFIPPPLLLSLSPPVYRCTNAHSTSSSKRTQVSALSALVQEITFVIHSQRLTATPEVHSSKVRMTESVCVCVYVCVCVWRYIVTLQLFLMHAC